MFPQVGRHGAAPPRRGEPSVLALVGLAIGAWMGLVATATFLFG